MLSHSVGGLLSQGAYLRTRLTGRCVGQALDQAAASRGWPKSITVDNRTEFTSKALDQWAYRRGIRPGYTRPGKPTDNGLIESFNGRLRDEFLNAHEFITMHDVRERLTAWQEDYNTCRPHGSLGHLKDQQPVSYARPLPQVRVLDYSSLDLTTAVWILNKAR